MKHRDKLLHLLAGAFLAALGLWAHGPAAAGALVLLGGAARELWNWQIHGTRWDWLDLAATVAGGAAVGLLWLAFTHT